MKNIFLFPVIYMALAGCSSSGEKVLTTPSGIQYKVFHLNASGKKAPMMATAKVTVRQFDNENKVVNAITADPLKSPVARMPLYQMVLPPAPFTTDALAEIMVTTGVKEGDSVLTISKHNKQTAYIIQKVFIPGEGGANTDSIIALDKKAETERLVNSYSILAVPRIEKYLQSKNITAVKNHDNTFTEIINAGIKPLADSGKSVGITFTITNLASGKTINSNRDTAFHQPPVLEYIVGKGFMPKAVDRAIQQLGKGGQARIYLPGVLVAGPKLNDPKADFSQDAVFEVELVSIK